MAEFEHWLGNDHVDGGSGWLEALSGDSGGDQAPGYSRGAAKPRSPKSGPSSRQIWAPRHKLSWPVGAETLVLVNDILVIKYPGVVRDPVRVALEEVWDQHFELFPMPQSDLNHEWSTEINGETRLCRGHGPMRYDVDVGAERFTVSITKTWGLVRPGHDETEGYRWFLGCRRRS